MFALQMNKLKCRTPVSCPEWKAHSYKQALTPQLLYHPGRSISSNCARYFYSIPNWIFPQLLFSMITTGLKTDIHSKENLPYPLLPSSMAHSWSIISHLAVLCTKPQWSTHLMEHGICRVQHPVHLGVRWSPLLSRRNRWMSNETAFPLT